MNTLRISGIKKNITEASEIAFSHSSKKAYASRNYIKALIDIMNEKRLKRWKDIESIPLSQDFY